MVTVARGHVYDRAGEVVFGALTESRRWDALQPAGKTFGIAGLAFVMRTTFTCAIDQILFKFWRQWPYKICLLLRPECFGQSCQGDSCSPTLHAGRVEFSISANVSYSCSCC